jgi:2'-5' RNA ligase
MPRPNWFFAFPIAGGFVEALPEPPVGFRRYVREDVHLTLAFLGGCGDAAAERALGVLDERMAAERQSAIEISLGDVVPMGSRRAYSALSALLEKGRAETELRIGAMRDSLMQTAIGRSEKRAPKAHVTIARPMRRTTDAHREAGLAWAKSLDLRHVEATVDRVALYTWNDNRRERLFRVVAERVFES